MENGLIHRILAFGDQLADEVDQAMTRSIRYRSQVAIYNRSGRNIHRQNRIMRIASGLMRIITALGILALFAEHGGYRGIERY